MKKILISLFAVFILMVFVVSAYTPASTNDVNRVNDWAHVNEISVGIGEVELEFVQPRSFFSCFEYRTDGDTSQVIDEEHFLEFYGVVDESEGLQQYSYNCLSTISSLTKIISANEYVEIRMIFGAEGDERFDWTRFDVIAAPTKADVLQGNGVPGKGMANAPGLQKLPPNENFA